MAGKQCYHYAAVCLMPVYTYLRPVPVLVCLVCFCYIPTVCVKYFFYVYFYGMLCLNLVTVIPSFTMINKNQH